jgi:hypothetical protein
MPPFLVRLAMLLQPEGTTAPNKETVQRGHWWPWMGRVVYRA